MTHWFQRALLLLCLLQFGVRLPAEMAPPVRVADASCAKCHAEIYKRYLTTPMANASGPLTEKVYPSSTVQSGSGIAYTFAYDAGQKKGTLLRSTKEGQRTTVPLEYFLGSGHLGTTYTYAIDHFQFESPIAWYAASSSFDLKPGLETMKRVLPSLPLQSGCLRCHMSDVQPSDPGTINRYSNSAFLHSGITCEACHGDTSSHVAKDGHVAMLKLTRLSAVKRASICINCHLEGDVLVARANRSLLNFAPGDTITDFAAYYVYGNKALTSRAVSEVEQFAQSHCKRASGERMSCTSCHDPHFTPAKAERVEFYRSKCLACHSDPQFAVAHHPENKDCVSCHMKPTGSENIPHVAWTDHRILRVPDTGLRDIERARNGELVPIFAESASKRDLAMAYYKAMLAGDQALEPVAWAKLNDARSEMENDSEALDALGVMMSKRGEERAAAEVFNKVLGRDANDLTALSNLGTLLAKDGHLEESLRLLNKAFSRNQDLPGLASNLARADCVAGESDAAQKVLDSALVYNPGLESLTQLRAQVLHCPKPNVR